MGNNGKQWTTMGNNGQQWSTMGNNGQQWATMSNNGQEWQNNGQEWARMDNNGQQSVVLHASLMPFFSFLTLFLSLQSPPGSPTLLMTQRAPQRWSHQQQQSLRAAALSSTLVHTTRWDLEAPHSRPSRWGVNIPNVSEWIIRELSGREWSHQAALLSASPIWDLAAPSSTLIHGSHAEGSTIPSVGSVDKTPTEHEWDLQMISLAPFLSSLARDG